MTTVPPSFRLIVAFKALAAFHAVAALAGAPAFAPAAASEIRAVVVGVNQYAHMPLLEGAVADARDIARAVGRLGGEVELHVEAAATRERVLGSLERAASRSGPGDLLIFAFAGHGVQEPAGHPGEESDGLDETILFAGFAERGAAAGERLRDNEIAALLASLHPEARALVIVDACHSGTITRAADRRGLAPRLRLAPRTPIADDPLPPAPPERAGDDAFAAERPNVLVAAAGQDHEAVPEVIIDGVPRGALSWSVARALEGEAGSPADALTPEAFAAFVSASVRLRAAGRQTPRIAWGEAAGAAPLAPTGSSARAPAATGPLAPPPRVAAPGLDGALETMRDALLPAEPAQAQLLWDAASGEIVDMETADVVGRADAPSGLRGAARRWRAARALARFQPARALPLRVTPEEPAHRFGETVHLVLDPPEGPARNLLIVNLASDGRVQTVFPPRGARPEKATLRPGDGPLRLGPAEVTPPAGLDLVVAVACACDLGPLEAAAREPSRDALDFVRALAALAEDAPVLIGAAALYSAP